MLEKLLQQHKVIATAILVNNCTSKTKDFVLQHILNRSPTDQQMFSHYGLDSVSEPLTYRIRLSLIFWINIDVDEKSNSVNIRESPTGKLNT